MRIVTAAAAPIAVLLCQTGEPMSLHTILQQDPWMLPLDPPSATVSADSRYVAFTSFVRLAPVDTNSRRDIYVLDRLDGHVTFESLTPGGRVSDVDSTHPRLSADGRLLVYETVLSPEAPQSEILLRDRLAGTVTVVSAGPGDRRANGLSTAAQISRDGRVIVFSSAATNLVNSPDANGPGEDIYLFDTRRGGLSRVSVDGAGIQMGSGVSVNPSVSGDGRYVAFASTANLDRAAGDPRAPNIPRRRWFEVYVRDTQRGVTRRVSVVPGGRTPDGGSWAPAITADGRYVAFVSAATNMTGNDRNRSPDVFLADLQAATLELVSRSAGGAAANGQSGNPAVSGDGRYVAFQSEGSDILCARRCAGAREDINLLWDVFLLDRQSGEMTRVSGDDNVGWMEPSAGPSMDGTGRLVVFSSRHPIDTSDTKNDFDLFVCAAPFNRRQPSSRAP